MPTLLYQGYEIFYNLEGEGSPIIFVHGLGGSSINWLYQRNHFKNQYKVIAIDLPGHGKSEGRDELTFYDYHKVLKQLLVDELFVKDLLICGISMGGRVAMDFSFHHPELVKGMIVADTFAGLDEEVKRRRKAVYDLLKEPGGEEKWIQRVIDEMGLDPEGPIAKGFHRGIFSQHLDFLYELFIQLLEYDQRDMLSQITVPTLILHGERDRFIDISAAKQMNANIPGSEFEVIPHCGHLPNVEQPKVFNELIEKFIQKIQL
jgi:pimeloyl-ACP methyl ester carboxylesterase